MKNAASYINELICSQNLSDEGLYTLICGDYDLQALFAAADTVRRCVYGNKVFIRGLIEFTNYCKNNCYYCGIRAENNNATRYRLTSEEILDCCREGYGLGFRTFVLQGGEDMHFTDDMICHIVKQIKKNHPDCAVTLSIGERPTNTYKKFKDAGADRYLLRHETATNSHYKQLHPPAMSLENRKRCLRDLKELGFETGSGFMVGSPYQTTENIIADIRFLQEINPHMIGIGPYITHKDTPFKEFHSGSVELTLRLISILRLMFPKALIPSTTALGTLHPQGRELGLKAGANVVMPNLSPKSTRKLYEIYENKICTDEEAAESIALLRARVSSAGYEIVTDIGGYKK